MKTILRLPEVRARTGLPRSTIYRRMSEGTFPAPISIGVRSVGWVAAEIEAWICQRIEQSRPSHRETWMAQPTATATTSPAAKRH